MPQIIGRVGGGQQPAERSWYKPLNVHFISHVMGNHGRTASRSGICTEGAPPGGPAVWWGGVRHTTAVGLAEESCAHSTPTSAYSEKATPSPCTSKSTSEGTDPVTSQGYTMERSRTRMKSGKVLNRLWENQGHLTKKDAEEEVQAWI